MTTIFITGMSGTGKSTVINLLQQRGYDVVETDEPGWCVPEDDDHSRPDSEWIWDERRIAELLDTHSGNHLSIDGCRPNQGKFYGRFDYVVVFTCSLETMLERVAHRTSNPFGQTGDEQAKIAADKAEFEPLLLASADVIIDTSTATPDQIADQLEALL